MNIKVNKRTSGRGPDARAFEGRRQQREGGLTMSSLALVGSVVVHGGVILFAPVSGSMSPAVMQDTVEFVVEEAKVASPTVAVPDAPKVVARHAATPKPSPTPVVAPAVPDVPVPPPSDPNPQPASAPMDAAGGLTSTDGGVGVSARAGSGSGVGAGAGNGVVVGNAQAVDLRALLKSWVVRVGQMANDRASADYPIAARRARIEGRVIVDLVVDAQGRIVDVRVKSSSGHEELDGAAVTALRAMGHVPPPPSEVIWHTRPLTFPILYHLEVR